MSNKCPVYKNNFCVFKKNFTKEFNKILFSSDLKQELYTKNCNGLIENCCFVNETVETQSQETTSETQEVKQEVKQETDLTKVSVHICENPYLVKSDVLVYPTNIVLTIDDPLLHRMSRGNIQLELDKFKKPIQMGTIYVTDNGGDNSKVQPKNVYHAVVAGESRLVNEEDIKSAVRKALHLALKNKVKNIVMMPPDCGTHDINDTARVHLSAVKTFLNTEKDCSIKNIFIVMSDQDSYEVYQQYYKRIFKK